MKTLPLFLFLSVLAFADVQTDILTLVAEQNAKFTADGSYVRTNPTPALVPTEGAATKFTKLESVENETREITFVPTAKDYQFHAKGYSVQKNVSGQPPQMWHGFEIIAKRELANGIIETLTYVKEEHQ